MAICASEKKLYLQKVTGIRRGRVYTVVKNEKKNQQQATATKELYIAEA